MPTLRVHLPNAPEMTFLVTGKRVTIGRRAENSVQIIDRSVSAFHAELVLVDKHYRLHDLGSTNRTAVEGRQVKDFHLHEDCKISFGLVDCTYAAAQELTGEPMMTRSQLEKDIAFLRVENQELRNRNDGLQRRLEMLGSARLVPRNAAGAEPDSLEIKKLTGELEIMRLQNGRLQLEMERLRQELQAALPERYVARRPADIEQTERFEVLKEEAYASNKGATQRLLFAAPRG